MTSRRKQAGATLLVTLVMLVVLTLFVVSALNSSTTSLRIAGNMQTQSEAAAAAQQAIEQILSSNFTASPAATTVTVTLNNIDYTVNVVLPTCISSLSLRNADLNASNSADLPCFSSGTVTAPGLPNSTTPSWCYRQQWDVKATVTNNRTGAVVNVHQGVALRVPAGTTCS